MPGCSIPPGDRRASRRDLLAPTAVHAARDASKAKVQQQAPPQIGDAQPPPRQGSTVESTHDRSE